MKRGDVVLVRFPHPSGQRGKKRPAGRKGTLSKNECMAGSCG